MALFTTVSFLPMYWNAARSLSAVGTGLQLLPLVLGITFGSTIAGRLLGRRLRVDVLAVLACGLIAAAFAAIAHALARVTAAELSVWLVLLGGGIGMTFPLVMVVCQSAAPRPLLGVATACPTLFRSAGGAVGVALFSALLSHQMSAQAGQAFALALGNALGVVLAGAAGLGVLGAVASLALPGRMLALGQVPKASHAHQATTQLP